MNIHVKYNGDDPDVYPAHYICKILQSGALQIRKPVEADVPEMDDDTKEMTVSKELVVAIYHSFIKCWRAGHEGL